METSTTLDYSFVLRIVGRLTLHFVRADIVAATAVFLKITNLDTAANLGEES